MTKSQKQALVPNQIISGVSKEELRELVEELGIPLGMRISKTETLFVHPLEEREEPLPDLS